MTIGKMNITSIVKNVYNFVLLFFYVFEMPIVGIITTRRLAIFLMCVALMGHRHRYTLKLLWNNLYRTRFIFSVIGLLFCMIISMINNIGLIKNSSTVYFEPIYIIYLLLYVIIAAFYVITEFKTIEEFSKLYISIMIFQSIIVYISVVNYTFRMYIYNHFYFDDDRFATSVEWGTRIMGVNLYASTGSLILFTACILLVYLILQKKISNYLFTFLYIVIMGATLFVGRTGFYLEIVTLIAYIFLSKRLSKSIFNLILITILSVLVVRYVLSNINTTIAEMILNWAGELFNANTRYNTLSILRAMEIPKFSSEMIFGTNVTLGRTPGGAYMGSDSGYAKIYCAIGIIGLVIYYMSILGVYRSIPMKKQDIKNRIYLILLVFIAFLIEYKEPYFLRYIYAWAVLIIYLYRIKENKNSEIG